MIVDVAELVDSPAVAFSVIACATAAVGVTRATGIDTEAARAAPADGAATHEAGRVLVAAVGLSDAGVPQAEARTLFQKARLRAALRVSRALCVSRMAAAADSVGAVEAVAARVASATRDGARLACAIVARRGDGIPQTSGVAGQGRRVGLVAIGAGILARRGNGIPQTSGVAGWGGGGAGGGTAKPCTMITRSTSVPHDRNR